MAARARHMLMIGAGLLISAVAVIYFVADVGDEWGNVWTSLGSANYIWLIPSVAALAIFYGFRSIRLRFFLRTAADVPLRTAASATLIGFMANCILPARAGEIIRPYVVHKKVGVPFGTAAGIAFGLERVFDLMGVAALFAACMVTLAIPSTGDMPKDHPATEVTALNSPAATEDATADEESILTPEKVRQYGTYMAALAGIGLAGLVFLAFAPDTVLHVGRIVLRPLPATWRARIMEFAEAMIRPIAFVRSPGRIILSMVYTLAIWAGICLSTWLLSFGFGIRLTLQSLLFIQLAVTIAVAVPQAPSFIGPFQLGVIAGAGLFDIGAGDAAVVAFANVLWLVNVAPITIVGLIVLHAEGLSLRRIARASEEAAEDIEGEETGEECTSTPGE